MAAVLLRSGNGLIETLGSSFLCPLVEWLVIAAEESQLKIELTDL